MSERRADPTAVSFLIGYELRVARERARISQVEASKEIGSSTAKINYLETGRTQQQPADIRKLLALYGVDEKHIDRVVSLAARADQNPWWTPFGEVLPDWFKTFVGLEGMCEGLFAFESMKLPGQVQTPEYARALFADSIEIAPLEIDQVVKARMARQRLETETAPLNFRAVIDEAVLHRLVGGPAVMRQQLEHLLDLMKRDNVELHIMPFSVPVHDGINGDFVLLDLPGDRSIGYVEHSTGALYVQDEDQLRWYKLAAERLCAAALSPAESADMLAERIAAIDNN
ncbi:helix-turn-helix domain-containing protein [Nocardia puris]|uniref:helix-turn-helix domain-containing protein n=1 Tax=Nocardia TaxID=1817 RepID=UPI0004A6CD66|nr:MULTISPECIES: helix-turn-helix transcriptional regulator [Nocardia]MBF6137229.1 helix-turn-helix domain-containing protein [Nocardia otitidiscaviarum]MBF6181833.1 helix-turn-helix domain-containing protein [Nocardia otitidiscaviarum]MBF6461726.1 helix-turn-helix domain-containing protein [Nocardia puris]MBF6488126.1 helix-turn-helix domain-containing protein [Nocardia otitidiscaviarum]